MPYHSTLQAVPYLRASRAKFQTYPRSPISPHESCLKRRVEVRVYPSGDENGRGNRKKIWEKYNENLGSNEYQNEHPDDADDCEKFSQKDRCRSESLLTMAEGMDTWCWSLILNLCSVPLRLLKCLVAIFANLGKISGGHFAGAVG